MTLITKKYLIAVKGEGPEEHLAEFSNCLSAVYEDSHQYFDYCWMIQTNDTSERIEQRLSKILYKGAIVVAEITSEPYFLEKD